jgi:AcrR family transcriptional regulator
MFEEGYAAVTSRRVAAGAGLKPQLVHYYFRTMDDLFLALFRRRAEQGVERLRRALATAQPLWALWDLSRDPRGTAVTMEFAVLANHRKEIRAEVAASAEAFRAELCAGIASVFERSGYQEEDCSPMILAVLMTSVSQVLGIEHVALGMSTGHAEIVGFVERLLTRLEGARRPLASGVASA